MTAWWSEQERLVWAVAARYLGAGVTTEDVEEVWLDFYTTVLARARLSYQPGGPDFCVYALNVCFKNHCVQQGQRIRRRTAQEISLSFRTPIDQQQQATTTNDPQKTVEQAAFFHALQTALLTAPLSEQQKEAFLLRYYCAMSYKEIACEMQSPIGSVKAWVHRATKGVTAALRTEGWLE